MKLVLHPMRSDWPLAIERDGDCLKINGEAFDFEPVEEGAYLPSEAIESEFFCGPVRRENGVLHVNLLLPHGPDAPEAVLFPEPVEVFVDGPVVLPGAA